MHTRSNRTGDLSFACSMRNRGRWSRTAVWSSIGMLTSPNEMDPFQMALGILTIIIISNERVVLVVPTRLKDDRIKQPPVTPPSQYAGRRSAGASPGEAVATPRRAPSAPPEPAQAVLRFPLGQRPGPPVTALARPTVGQFPWGAGFLKDGGGVPVDVGQLACQRARQVEAEPVDVHVQDPVAQAVHDELEVGFLPALQPPASTRAYRH